MSNWVVETVSSMGYLGICFLMLLENVFPPLPSELVMPLGGYLASKGRMELIGVIIAGVFGGVFGQVLLYVMARKLGEKNVRDWVCRHGRWLTISPRELSKATKWFHEKGWWAVLVGRVVPGIRSLISIPAGLGRMHFVPFLLYTTLGSSVWTAALAWAGLELGNRFAKIEEYLSPITWTLIGLALIVYLYRVITYKAEDPSPNCQADPAVS